MEERGVDKFSAWTSLSYLIKSPNIRIWGREVSLSDGNLYYQITSLHLLAIDGDCNTSNRWKYLFPKSFNYTFVSNKNNYNQKSTTFNFMSVENISLTFIKLYIYTICNLLRHFTKGSWKSSTNSYLIFVYIQWQWIQVGKFSFNWKENFSQSSRKDLIND